MTERKLVPGAEAEDSPGAAPPRPESSPADRGPQDQTTADGVPRAPRETAVGPGRTTAALRQELDEQAAATNELRIALDELRHALDIEHPPSLAGPRTRRALTLVAVSGAVIALIGGFLTWRDPAAGPISRAAATAPAQVTAPSASGADPATRPMAWQGSTVLVPPGLPRTGPGLDAPGTHVQVALDADHTHLDVFAQVLAERPSAEPLQLTSAEVPAGLRPTYRDRLTVTDLQVELDGRATAVTTTGDGGWRAAPPAGQSYTRATLRYRIGAAVTVLAPAAPGRALAVATPLVAAADRPGPRVLAVTDPAVRGVSCPGAPAAASLCGSRTLGGWSARLPDSVPAVVLLQYDLP